MTQSLVIQVGQCGNQMGYKFWDLALQEHLAFDTEMVTTDSWFRTEEKSTSGKSSLKARALLVDMEEGVISQILKGPRRDIFDSTQQFTDVSGSGNNWAVGYSFYGSMYADKIENLIRKEVEMCDCLQCILLLHSTSGGTGSGLGTRILENVCHAYPKKQKFVIAVYPSPCDDVIIAPYNTLLAHNQLIEFADCVFPVENKALAAMAEIVISKQARSDGLRPLGVRAKVKEKSFEHMNSIVAELLLNMTCSSRFSGELNIDVNELTMNMIPYPRMHFLGSSLAPLGSVVQTNSKVRINNSVFNELFLAQNHLTGCEIKKGTFLACGLIARGNVNYSDLQNSIIKLYAGLKFAPWSQNGWKTGLCAIPPLSNPYSTALISNNTAMCMPFHRLMEKFMKMYSKKAHLHHFNQVSGFDDSMFSASLENLEFLLSEYKLIAGMSGKHILLPRMNIAI